MKFFDPYAALKEIEKQGHPPATSATSATKTAPDVQKVAKVAKVATPQAQIPKSDEVPADDMRHGFAINGYPRTWRGNIVSLAAWRNLTDWQKHGPDGRVWCGNSKQWRPP